MQKIAVLILSTQENSYAGFIDAIKFGWAADFRALNIPCYFYEGGHENQSIDGDLIKVNERDEIKFSAKKFKAAVKLLLSAHPDTSIVYRTNLSSYIDVEPFLKFIEAYSLDEYSYAGVPWKTSYIKEIWCGNRWWQKFFTLFPIGKKVVFASGAGFFLGRKHLDRIADDRDNFSMRMVDDVMVAVKINRSPDLKCTPHRIVYQSDGSHILDSMVYDELVRNNFLFHYRFKTNNRELDAELIRRFSDPSYRRCICVGI